MGLGHGDSASRGVRAADSTTTTIATDGDGMTVRPTLFEDNDATRVDARVYGRLNRGAFEWDTTVDDTAV